MISILLYSCVQSTDINLDKGYILPDLSILTFIDFFFHEFCAHDFLKIIRPIPTISSQVIASRHNSRSFLKFWNRHYRFRFMANFVSFYDQFCADINSETIRYNYEKFWIGRAMQYFDISGAMFWSSPRLENWIRI